MILKRLLTTALGALGLSALAAGSAFGQTPGSSNIPAPDIFDDQITCTQLLPTPAGFNLPSTVPMAAETSPLDDIIGMGTNRLATTGDNAIPDDVADRVAKLAGLGYVIPAGNMNCGAGTTGPMLGDMNIDANDDGDLLDTGDTVAWGSIPKDVADGYTNLLAKYTDVYGAPGGTTGGTLRALEAAQELLDKTDSSLTALVEARVKARDAAQTAHNKALAAFNAASAGPVYQAGVAEWKAQAAVNQSIDDYNKQVTKTNTAKSSLDNMQYSNYTVGTADQNFAVTQGDSKYVPLTNNSLVATTGTAAVVTVTMGMGAINTANLAGYAGGTETSPVYGTAAVPATDTVDAMGSSSANSNFTELGVLILPKNAWNHDNDDTTPLVLRDTVSANGENINDVTTIRDKVENTRIAAATLKKARDDNTNPRFQALYDEAYRRAKLEQDYYDALWNQVLADTTDTRSAQQRLQYVDTNNNGINEASEQTAANINNASNANATAGSYYEASPLTIASRNATYDTESGKRKANETSLRGLVADREAATKDVIGQFTNARAFYQQLVDRRQALKAAADKAVADATNPSDAQTKAAADAAKALTDAQADKGKIDALFPDDADSPVTGLVGTLLKTGGDDGQALVDAVSSNYTAAAEAKTAADAAKAKADEVAESVAGLTGDDGSVGENTAAIATNAAAIEKNTDDIDGIEMALYGTTDPTELAHDDEAACSATGLLNTANCNKAAIAHNAGAIAENAGAIDDNSDAIDDLDGRVDDNADNIATNAENILANAENIMTNAGNIMSNTMAIEANDADIATNADGIAANAGNIMSNTMAIEANDADIAMNAEDIMTNAGNIATNADGIATNAGNISMNADNIATNAGAIGENAGNIATNAAGIADNMASIGANMSAISANTNSIGANASAISRNASMIGELSEDLDVVRAGVAASMALAGMPAINGRGIAIGVGSYDGESAFAVGFQIQGEQASFKIGVTSSGGETGASAGVGFNF